MTQNSNKTLSLNKIHPQKNNNEQIIKYNTQETNQKKDKDGLEQKAKIIKRQKKVQHIFFYWSNLIIYIVFAYSNFFMFFITDIRLMNAGGIIASLIIDALSITASCTLSQTKKDCLMLYFLLDAIFIAAITAIVGVIGIVYLTMPSQSLAKFTLFLWTLQIFIIAGNSRVLIAYIKFKKWQTIVLKLGICLGFLSYLIMATYFMIHSFPNLRQASKEIQDTIRDLFFLYIFGLFTLYMEIYSKLSDIDGSSNLQYHYRIDQQTNYQQVSLNESIQDQEQYNQKDTLKNKTKEKNIQQLSI